MIIDLRDYVPPEVFKTFGSRSTQFIDKRVIEIHKALTANFGSKPFVNNYHLGGKLRERGFRMPDTTTGASLSQHRFGRAIDFSFTTMSAQEAWNDIQDNPQFLIDVGCTTIEDITYTRKGNWVHLDCRWLDYTIKELKIVMP